MVSVVSLARAKTCTCYNCKTVLEYTYSDMKFSFEKDYTGCGDRVARIVCPVCHVQPAVPVNF